MNPNLMLSVLRIVAGLLFLEHGTQKMLHFPPEAAGHYPALATLAGLSGLIELIGGALIMVGLFTRVAAFICSGEMAVAYFMVHAHAGLTRSPTRASSPCSTASSSSISSSRAAVPSDWTPPCAASNARRMAGSRRDRSKRDVMDKPVIQKIEGHAHHQRKNDNGWNRAILAQAATDATNAVLAQGRFMAAQRPSNSPTVRVGEWAEQDSNL